VHASDIQLLESKAVQLILDWQPDITLVGGLPLHPPCLSWKRREVASGNALRLAHRFDTLILDRHLLRCDEGLSWPGRLSSETGHRVILSRISWSVSAAYLRPNASNRTRICRFPKDGIKPTPAATPIFIAIGIVWMDDGRGMNTLSFAFDASGVERWRGD
jgi:hypothetical protein